MRRNLKVFRRVIPGLIGATFILYGVESLLKGEVGYSNYWGGFVFAPFARYPHEDIRKW
jgi:hypothetical protein